MFFLNHFKTLAMTPSKGFLQLKTTIEYLLYLVNVLTYREEMVHLKLWRVDWEGTLYIYANLVWQRFGSRIYFLKFNAKNTKIFE